jgi:nicotinate-nucleotide adenylyltransferase
MDIAVFGGSFDPPHIGHEQIVNMALLKLNIEKIFVVPTFLNPFKENFHIKPQERFNLLCTLFNGNQKVEILDYEILQNEKTPTFKTISYLKQMYDIDKLYLIVGADNLKNIHLWYNFLELRELVSFVVVTRNGIKLTNDYIKPTYLELDIKVSSTDLRANMDFDLIPQNLKEKVKEIWKKEYKQ